jgi:hypothetical protein
MRRRSGSGGGDVAFDLRLDFRTGKVKVIECSRPHFQSLGACRRTDRATGLLIAVISNARNLPPAVTLSQTTSC